MHYKVVEASLADQQLVDYLQRSQSKRAYAQVCPAKLPWCNMCCRRTQEVFQLSAVVFVASILEFDKLWMDTCMHARDLQGT